MTAPNLHLSQRDLSLKSLDFWKGLTLVRVVIRNEVFCGSGSDHVDYWTRGSPHSHKRQLGCHAKLDTSRERLKELEWFRMVMLWTSTET